MSFATLEEAWGMLPTAAAVATPPVGAGRVVGQVTEEEPNVYNPNRVRKPGRVPFRKMRGQQQGQVAPQVAVPTPGMYPQRAEDEAEALTTRQYLARTYARYGIVGVARLLPPEAQVHLRGVSKRQSVWKSLARFFSDPEKLLFVLVCAFALLLLWDSLTHKSSSSSMVPDVTSLSLHPFPMATMSP